MIKCAIITFPGNNCETETLHAAKRNGFEAKLFRWNEVSAFEQFEPQFIILPGGFSFEDRGRSGVIASKEPIFETLRRFAKKGVIIMGICNGAQMVVESALIPAEIGLAKNIRRDNTGHVLGTGFFNTWVHLTPENKHTVFTKHLHEKVLSVPVAHGEGRFVSEDITTKTLLQNGDIVAFRYSDSEGNVSDKFPITPNGSMAAVAAITNKEGTIMAIMPHPERFYKEFDGDAIFQSVKKSIEMDDFAKTVEIGHFEELEKPLIKKIKTDDKMIILEKKLIIMDNENFSIKMTAQHLVSQDINLEKTIRFQIKGDVIEEALLETGLILNTSKEFIIPETFSDSKKSFYTADIQDDEADHLAEQLSIILKTPIKVKIYKGWHFDKQLADDLITKIISARLLANPNATETFS